MIDDYFANIEQILQRFPLIQTYALTQKRYNATQGYITGTIVFESGSRLDFMEFKHTDTPAKIKYRYQYMNPGHEMIFRYDNAPHHKHLKTFPHHKHLFEGEHESVEPTLEDVLLEIATLERAR